MKRNWQITNIKLWRCYSQNVLFYCKVFFFLLAILSTLIAETLNIWTFLEQKLVNFFSFSLKFTGRWEKMDQLDKFWQIFKGRNRSISTSEFELIFQWLWPGCCSSVLWTWPWFPLIFLCSTNVQGIQCTRISEWIHIIFFSIDSTKTRIHIVQRSII